MGVFDQQRHALAATDAGGCDPVAQAVPAQLPSQGVHQPQAGGGQRVAQGDGTTMNVELFHIELQRPGHGQHLGSLGLVDFETVDLRQAQAAAFQQQRDGWGRPMPMVCGDTPTAVAIS